MFKSLSICATALLLFVAEGTAQTLQPVGFVEKGGSVELALAPTSALIVDITVEHEKITVGPYARYAQKFLGVRAPLVDKEISTIVSASVMLAPEDYYVAKCAPSADLEVISTEMLELPINVRSSRVEAAEDAAEDAAEAIFNVRAQRAEVLRGELGEGFYSGGLEAALQRFEYEEKQYISMFMGQTTRTRESHRFFVQMPDGNKTTQLNVCKYSTSAGVLADADAKGDQITVKLTPTKAPEFKNREITDKSKVVNFRIPVDVKCDLVMGGKVLDSKYLPLYEFGFDYAYPIYTK